MNAQVPYQEPSQNKLVVYLQPTMLLVLMGASGANYLSTASVGEELRKMDRRIDDGEQAEERIDRALVSIEGKLDFALRDTRDLERRVTALELERRSQDE